jgi:amphi-Trp domain-containing protein
MGRETVLFKSEEKKTRSEIAEILRLLADKVEQGHMILSNEAGNVDLAFPENMILEIKAEEETKRKTKRSLEIELEWPVGGGNRAVWSLVDNLSPRPVASSPSCLPQNFFPAGQALFYRKICITGVPHG